jgi:hypothetical protein
VANAAAPVVTAPAVPVDARRLVDAPPSAIVPRVPAVPAVPEARVVLAAPVVPARVVRGLVALEVPVVPD